MNWTEYQFYALRTVVYPKEYGIAYTTLGLVDELCEFYDSIGSDEEKAELSDCCWYIACFAYECGVNLRDTEELAGELEDQVSFHDIFDATGAMRDSASRICGHIKKYLRGDSKMDNMGKLRIQLELASIILSIYYICNELGTIFTEVAEINIEKLFSRKERGVLRGNGGKR